MDKGCTGEGDLICGRGGGGGGEGGLGGTGDRYTQLTTEPIRQGRTFYTTQAFNNHEMPFKKDFSVFILLADT